VAAELSSNRTMKQVKWVEADWGSARGDNDAARARVGKVLFIMVHIAYVGLMRRKNAQIIKQSDASTNKCDVGRRRCAN
jgi:hypothetical protein